MNRQGSKVLIIDDENSILKLLTKVCNRIGLVVDVANNAERGINKINSNQYDLILTDIKMPGMSGDDVCKHVKANVNKPTPVIAMSGTPWLLGNSEFDAVIAKPFNQKQLLDAISQFI